MKTLRFGIVGCGVIGPVHAEAIASLPHAELVAVADPLVERAQELAQRFGVRSHGNLANMLEDEDLDVVNVCTPSGLHGKHAIQVMRSGQNVIVEKPIEISLPAIDEMLRVQQEMGVKMAVISQHRFDPASQEVRGHIEARRFGRIVMGNAHLLWWRSQAYYDSGAWRGTWELDGGGVLMNQTIHSIDLLTWLAGPVRSVRAYTGTLAHHMETEDVAVAALRFQSGALGTIAATTSAYPGVATRVEILGDRGSAIVEDDRLAFIHLRSADDEEAPAYGVASQSLEALPEANSGVIGTAQDPSAVPSSTHAAQIADMIRAIRENTEPLVDGQTARHAVEVIQAIYRSAQSDDEVILA
jgi:UDP-N-acetyl-2-amino-2-deoxyglucuronate dehydrogenase